MNKVYSQYSGAEKKSPEDDPKNGLGFLYRNEIVLCSYTANTI